MVKITQITEFKSPVLGSNNLNPMHRAILIAALQKSVDNGMFSVLGTPEVAFEDSVYPPKSKLPLRGGFLVDIANTA